MTYQSQPRMNAEQFLHWCGRQSGGRYELVNGEIVMMAPEKVRHVHVKMHAWLALRNAVRAARLNVTVHGDGVAVRIDEHTVGEPDVSINAGTIDPDSVLIEAPIVLVEVLSPSSERSDTGAKLAEYFQIVSLRHYLILDPARNMLIHHRRAESGEAEIETSVVQEGVVELAPPGLSVDLAHLFGEADQ